MEFIIQKKLKKGIALLTAAVMLLSLLPFNVFADEEYIYATMNIPYEVFYNAIDSNAEQENVDGVVVDAISTATTSKFLGTTGLAKGSYNDGTAIKGVAYPVKMTQSTYEALSVLTLTVNDDYYFELLEEVPSSYLTVTYADGVYSFDTSTVSKTTIDSITVDELTCTGGYGDYQITLNGLATADMLINGEAVTLSGVIMETSDGGTYAMYVLNNFWMGTRITNVEVAWSVVNGQGICRGHGSGDPYYQYDMNGKTLTGVSLITDKGIYDIDCNVELPKYYDGTGEFSVEANEGDSEISVSVPSELEGVTVDVTYKSGRTTVYAAEATVITDGKITLTEAIDCAANGSYTITVNSSNYAPRVITLDAPITDAQKTTLEELIATGQALADADSSLTTLAAHVQEAQELLANADATSSDASELISELQSLIDEAQVTYVTMNIPYEVFYNAIDSNAEQENVDGVVVDAISTATTSKFLGTTGLAKGSYNDGTAIKGVAYPVKMTQSTYEALSESTLTVNDDYYFELLEEVPSSYLTVTYADGVYSFDTSTVSKTTIDSITVDELTCTGGYGDYQITLNGLATADMLINGEAVTLSGVILETSDGGTYAMYVLNNFWLGTRVTNVEVAWSVVNGQGICRGHGSGDPFYQYDMNGKTLTGVSLITDKGIYDIDCNVELPKYYDGTGEFSVEANEGDSEISVSVPSELEGVTVDVTYKSSRTTVYAAEAAVITDGKIILTEAIDCAANGSYTITVNSSNYAPKVITLDAPITDAQKTTLEELIATGQALADADSSLTTLAAHVQEAQELLANADATSSDASELISELEALIAEALTEDYIVGDVNNDGELTAADAASALQKTLVATFLTECEEAYPNDYMNIIDVNQDDEITAADAASILQKVLNSSYEFAV